jgi:hypothetical protein
VGKVERPPAMDGKRMTAMLMPIKAIAKPRVNPAVEAKPNSLTGPTGGELNHGLGKMQPG